MGPGLEPARLVVVVPCLDEAERLPALLARLCSSGGAGALGDRAWRVVVADGGSRDGSIELARRAGVEHLEAQPGRGSQLAAGVERALELLRDEEPGDLVLCTHADNLPEPGALAALRAAARTKPGAVAFAMSQRIDAEGRFYRMVERTADRRAARGLVYGDSGLAVRPTAYRAAGGFLGVPLFEDLDLSRRLAALGEVQLVRSARIRVDARRWKAEGALRTTVRNWILTIGWRLGVPPEQLVRWYPRHGGPAERSTASPPIDP
ncbi:MAG: glycosyltransferase [Planctomycetota bacterium]|nr:glycosyltransferase [Planctomycetota bacterium]